MNPINLMVLAQAGVGVSLARSIHIDLYVVPLIVTISLVYAASRHEPWPKIWGQSLRIGGMICGILLVTTVVLLLINTQV